MMSNKHNSIIIIVGVFTALLLRWGLLLNQSFDFRDFWNPWYDFIVSHGGFQALKYEFANYTPAFLYLMVITTYFFSFMSRVIAVKLISIPFDFVCAWFVYKIVRLKYPTGKLPIMAFLAVLFAPTVAINASYWSQSDIIYTTGLVACIYFLCIQKNSLAFICFGLAFSFKLQSLFFAPVLVILLLKRVVSWRLFLIIPLVYLITVLPAWWIGRPLKDLLLIYLHQTGAYKYLTLQAPNLYQWIPNEYYNWVAPIGLLLTFTIVVIICYNIYESYIPITCPLLIQISLVFVLIVPYFLPEMHERYFFAADVISIIFAFYFPHFFFVPIAVILISMFSYFPFLIGPSIFPLPVLALILGEIIIIVIYHLHISLKSVNSEQ